MRSPSQPLHLVVAVALLLVVAALTPTGLAAERQAYRTAYACEGTTLDIECETGTVINVIRANYGRFSITICNVHGNTEWSVNCQSPRTHRVLSERCNGRSECKFEVSSEFFGDPCPGTFKYIEIHYMCGIATTTTTSPRTPPLWFITTKPPMWLPAFNTTSSTTTTTSTSTTTSTTTTTQKPTSVSTSTTTPKPPTSTTTSALPPSTSTAEDSKSPKETNVEEETRETEEKGKGKDKDMEEHVTTVDQQEITTLPSVASASSTVSPQVPKQTFSPTSAPPHAQSPPVSPPDIGTDNNSYDTPWCPPSFGRGLYWNWTMGGDISVQPCPGGASGWARRQCLLSGWKGPADLSECRSIWLTALEERALAHESVLAVAADLATVTASKPLYGGDLTTTARLVSTLSRRMVQVMYDYPDSKQRQAIVTELVQSALTTGSALLAEGMDGPWGDLSYKERRNAATQLMVGLEEAGFLLANELPSDRISSHDKAHVLLSARAVSSQGDSVRFPSSEDNDAWGHVDFVALPPEAIIENRQGGVTRIVFLTYRHMETILVPQDEPLGHRYSSSSRRNASRFVNSRVVSASLGHGRHIQLPEPVTLIFRLLRQDNVTNPVCAFWDYTSATWSDEGCRVTHHNQSHVTCKCDHLTNFAVIMEEMTGSVESDTMAALRVVAYVGCVVSAVCVAGAALTFLLLRGLASPRTVIRKHLCICLFATEVVFLLGVWRTEVPILCAVIAGVLHYTLLSAFTWMFMEGVYVYVTLVRVVECDSLRLRWWHYVLAYGFPLLVVAIAAIADPFSFGTPAYCWLRTDNYFVFSFVGPVLLLLAAEVLLLAAALVYICRINPDDAVKTKEMARLADASGLCENALHHRLHSHMTWLRGSLALLLLMVLTWTLGLLFLHQPSLPIAASFCVLNALVGIFIFVYYCFRNQKYLPALCQLNGVKGSTGNCPPPGGHLLSGATSTGTGGSLRHTGVSGPLPLGALHQSLPRHHTVTLPRHTSITTARSTTTTTPGHTTFNSLGHDEDASYKSFSRDSGHGGSEQEDSPRTQWNNHGQPRYSNSLTADLKNAYLAKLNSMNAAGVTDLLNSQFPHIQPNGNVISVPNSYTTTLTPTTQQMTASTRRSGGPRAHSPWNHTYMEIETEADPVYEEIERERWAGRGAGMNGANNSGNVGGGGAGVSEVMQVSDMSDEDGKRGTPSDMSRQSSRSYGDSRPLLPYHSSASQGHHPRYSQEHQFALSEERLRDFNMAQMSRDLEQLQQVQQQWSRESLMTVAVLNGEQVVCRLTSPSNPQAPQSLPVIHEGGRSVMASPMGAPQMAQQPMTNGYPAQVVVSHAPIHHRPPQYSEC